MVNLPIAPLVCVFFHVSCQVCVKVKNTLSNDAIICIWTEADVQELTVSMIFISSYFKTLICGLV